MITKTKNHAPKKGPDFFRAFFVRKYFLYSIKNMTKTKHIKNDDKTSNCDTCGIDLPVEQLEDGECWQCTCDHEVSEYHPEDKKHNIPETHYCSECGSDLLHV